MSNNLTPELFDVKATEFGFVSWLKSKKSNKDLAPI